MSTNATAVIHCSRLTVELWRDRIHASDGVNKKEQAEGTCCDPSEFS